MLQAMTRARINISLAPETVADLKAMAETRRSNVSAVIEQLVLAEKRAAGAPSFRVRMDGSLLDVRVALSAVYGDNEVAVRADGTRKTDEAYSASIAAERKAARELSKLGLNPDPSGALFVAAGEAAARFWILGITELPEDWDLFVPEHLVDTRPSKKGAEPTREIKELMPRIQEMLREAGFVSSFGKRSQPKGKT